MVMVVVAVAVGVGVVVAVGVASVVMRRKDTKHIAFIRTLNCCICGDNTSTEAAHVRMADRSIGKPICGIGIKPDDKWCLPLCSTHHRAQHEQGEKKFWLGWEKDPVKLALAIWDARDDHYKASEIIRGQIR